jgi:serine/threonine-protein kinase RsbW
VTGDVYELSGLAIPDGLTRLHDLLERAAAEHADVEPTDAMLFQTAVIEIANNVVEHGRPKGEVSWRFLIEIRHDRLVATVSDSGDEIAVPITDTMPEGLEATGHGLPMAQAALDELTYERAGGRNRWRMVRLRHGRIGSAAR